MTKKMGQDKKSVTKDKPIDFQRFADANLKIGFKNTNLENIFVQREGIFVLHRI